MLEQPVQFRQVLASSENLFHFALRCRHQFLSQRNPNNKLTVSSDQYKDYFKFTVVRNPWARAFSWYKNCMRDPNHRKRYGLNDATSLFDFLQQQVGRGSLRTQTSWLKDYSDKIAMDYVARFESLQSGFQEICDALQLPAMTLPHELKGSGSDYREQFDEQSIRLISTTYKTEIDMFGYTFES